MDTASHGLCKKGGKEIHFTFCLGTAYDLSSMEDIGNSRPKCPWYKRKEYMMNMLGSIPHQKFCFYHLPTRGRAGCKLGDDDMSPTYL